MRFSTFLYSLGQGFRNIWRHKLFSLASIATMTACIFLFGLFYSLGVNIRGMIDEIESDVAVVVYFNEGTQQETLNIVEDEIKMIDGVDHYEFVSAEEAWEDAKASYFEGREELAAGFTSNPLVNSYHYDVYLEDVEKQEEIVNYLMTLPGVREVKSSSEVADTLIKINNIITFVFTFVVVLLLAVATFLISNTIRVGIVVRREEIKIMKLMGAKDSLVRTPFLVEGVIIGIVGSIIPIIILFSMYESAVRFVAENALNSLVNVVPVGSVFAVFVPVALLLGIGIGFFGSRMTIRKHLKV